ncbi:uncharacterized protein LOC135948162 isoform X2 [Cloeon dipterum]|uniref:uncharacterized protein LOC135948162 isoform X2 n=1 Tax=Cloeon dipterum TaxID=197152 RepID=UPI0032207760
MGGEDKRAEFELLKKHLKSIVVMSKRVLTPGGLAHEYQDQIGKPMDFGKFGVYSMVNLLKLMPDTFILVQAESQGRSILTVQLKDFSKVGHIHEMVVNQRCNKVFGMVKTNWNTYAPNNHTANRPTQDQDYTPRRSPDRYYRPRRPRSSSPAPRRRSHSPEQQRHRRSRSPSRSKSRPRRRSRSRRRSPSRHRSGSRKHRRSSTSSDSTHSSHSTTTSEERHKSSSKLKKKVEEPPQNTNNATSGEEWAPTLESTSDESPVRTQPSVTSNLEMSKITQLTRVLMAINLPFAPKGKQASAESDPKAANISERGTKRSMDTIPLEGNAATTTAAATTRGDEIVNPPAKKVGEETISSSTSASIPPLNPAKQNFGSFYQQTNYVSQSVRDDNDSLDSMSISTFCSQEPRRPLNAPVHGATLPSYVLRNLTRLIQKYPKGIEASQLCNMYKTCYDQVLRVQDYGFNTPEEMVTAMPGQFIMSGTNNNIMVSCPAGAPSVATVPKATVQTEVAAAPRAAVPSDPRRLLPLDLKMRIREISSSFKNGATPEAIDQRYKALYNTGLDPARYGFNTLKEMLQNIDGIKVETLGVMTRVMPNIRTTAPNLIETITINDEFFIDKHDRFVRVGYVLDAMPNKFTPSQPNMSVVVCEVYSPARFYIQYQKFQTKIDILMEELRKCYSGNVNDFRLARMEEGVYVATQYMQKWHRGVISKVLSHTTAMVSYVDFGTDEEKNITDLYYLLDKPALKVHMMSAVAELNNVKPLGPEGWTTTARERFSELVGSNSLVAKYRSGGTMQGQTLKLSLSQVDITTQRIVLDVAEHLINEEHATYIEPMASTRVELVPPETRAHNAEPSTPSFQQSSVHGRFSNVDLTPSMEEMHAQQQAVAFTAEVGMVTSILQDINRKLSTKYGERVVVEALEKVRLKPFADTDVTTLSHMSNMLWSSLFPPLAPLAAGGQNLLDLNSRLPSTRGTTVAAAPMMPMMPSMVPNMQPTAARANLAAHHPQLASMITPQGIRPPMERKPTIMDLVKAECGNRQ